MVKLFKRGKELNWEIAEHHSQQGDYRAMARRIEHVDIVESLHADDSFKHVNVECGE